MSSRIKRPGFGKAIRRLTIKRPALVLKRTHVVRRPGYRNLSSGNRAFAELSITGSPRTRWVGAHPGQETIKGIAQPIVISGDRYAQVTRRRNTLGPQKQVVLEVTGYANGRYRRVTLEILPTRPDSFEVQKTAPVISTSKVRK